MEYYGIMPERKLWVKVAVIIFGVYTIYNSAVNHNLFYLPFGIIMILATFSDRKHVISEEGVDILYTVCGVQFHNMWVWSEINTIHTDSIRSKPNVELHIGKDVVSRRFILSKADANKAVAIAGKMNSKIYIQSLGSP
ncbi:MAG: hypothetical protein ACRC76_01355 [Proteocatella sp.]